MRNNIPINIDMEQFLENEKGLPIIVKILEALSGVAFSGKYTDLTETPTKLSQFENDLHFGTGTASGTSKEVVSIFRYIATEPTTIYSLPDSVLDTDSIELYYHNIRLIEGDNYVINDKTVTLAFELPVDGEIVNLIKAYIGVVDEQETRNMQLSINLDDLSEFKNDIIKTIKGDIEGTALTTKYDNGLVSTFAPYDTTYTMAYGNKTYTSHIYDDIEYSSAITDNIKVYNGITTRTDTKIKTIISETTTIDSSTENGIYIFKKGATLKYYMNNEEVSKTLATNNDILAIAVMDGKAYTEFLDTIDYSTRYPITIEFGQKID